MRYGSYELRLMTPTRI